MELENKHAAYALCERCKLTIAFKTSNYKVTEHMKKFHSNELAQYVQDAAQQRPRRLDGALCEVSEELRPISSEEQQQLNRMLAKWIAVHFRPLAMVEDKGFVELVTFMTDILCNIKASIPKRTQLRGCIITLAAELRLEVRDDIIQYCLYCLYFSFTSDTWTSRNARSYIAFTIHFVDENFVPHNWTLEVRELPGIHTGEVIAQMLAEIMEEWGLRKEYCTRFVRDSGSNMVKAGKFLGVFHAPCVAHELHLVLSGAMSKQKRSSDKETPLWASIVNAEPDVIENEHEDDDALNEDERADTESLRDGAIDEMMEFVSETLESLHQDNFEIVRSIVQKFRSLSVYFRKSSKAHNCLDAIQQTKLRVPKQKVVNLIVDCPTRWNSCWLMLKRCARLEPALEKFFEHLFSADGRVELKDMQNKLEKPQHREWLASKCLCVLLNEFAAVSKMLGGQVYPTLPLVMPAIDALEDILDDRNLFDDVLDSAGNESYVEETKVVMRDYQDVIKELFEKRFANLKSSELNWIAYLDPRVPNESPDFRNCPPSSA